MKKLFEKDPSYYRINLGAGSLIYFSHAIDVAEQDYIDLSLKDIIVTIDHLIEAYSALITISDKMSADLNSLKEKVSNLGAKAEAIGDQVFKLQVKLEKQETA